MVGRAKRPPVGQFAAGQSAGDGKDHRNFEQFAGRQGRQDRRQSGRQHALSSSGRTVEEKVVPARRGDFQRTFGALLALDLTKIRQDPAGCANGGRRP
jgi:hypothetical protein